MTRCSNILSFVAILFANTAVSQQQVTSIVTSNSTLPVVSYANVKGAGLRNAMGVMSSLWDSTGSSFTVNYNSVPNNITTLQQFNVMGHAQPFIKQPVNAMVKIRRTANGYVNDTRDHYNFWSVYSSIPVTGALGGTFNIVGPEVTSPEASFASNNLNSGYDNIFQNTINSLHSGNIERIDFIVPEGVRPSRAYDVNNSGIVVLDRGTGDPFKVAVITSVDANNDPSGYGPLISVAAINFGPDLMPVPVNYCILVHDPAFSNQSRPSTSQLQNMRGVFLSFSNLGVPVGQRIYGYSLFGQDVAAANVNWNTYPNNSNFASQLDPVNVLSFFRDISAILPVPATFEIENQNKHPHIEFNIFNEMADDIVRIERSFNGKDFEQAGIVEVKTAGKYGFTDQQLMSGLIYYRLWTKETDGSKTYSAIKSIRLKGDGIFHLSPNPATNRIIISLSSAWDSQSISLSIWNSGGLLVMQKRLNASGTQTVEIDKIPPGIYQVSITNELTKQTEARQLIVSR